MNRKIKNCFDFMELDYNSNIEALYDRKNVMIKVLNTKSLNDKSKQKQINKISNCTKIIKDFIGANPDSKIENRKKVRYDFITQLIILTFLILACAISLRSILK